MSASVSRDVDRGDVWVETLCKELACDAIDNFAHSAPSAAGAIQLGSLVDAAVHAEAKTGNKSNESALIPFDFKTQVEQFIKYEEGRRLIPQRLRGVDEWTVFTVFFGLWDLLEYSTLEKQSAMRAIDRSIEELFKNLDVLAQNDAHQPKVVIPQMVDVTFLPRFQSKKRGATQAQFASTQHQLVFIWMYWNTVLLRTASQWEKGTVYMPEPNDLIMQQVRAKQLHSRQISDATGVGKQAPLFEYVEQPCLDSQHRSVSDLHASAVQKCSAPDRHLFWDDVQLSGPAHELIGRQAVSLIRGNQSVNIERATQGSKGNAKPKEEEGEGFNLKFPPGYYWWSAVLAAFGHDKNKETGAKIGCICLEQSSYWIARHNHQSAMAAAPLPHNAFKEAQNVTLIISAASSSISKMLASRVLPPIVRTSPPLPPPTPVAVFFNVPRRYVKSSMHVGDKSPESPLDDAKPARSLRKSSRINESRAAPTSNPAERVQKEEPPSTAVTSPRTTRKRLSSLVEIPEREDFGSPTEERAPPSATSAGSPDFSGHVCLCQPEPKIPRPRNAFILYRQHHQQAIIARNPGLNNPDISKIIGEQWKAEGDEQKKVWQDLAQEEKARHQEQYPDYRYQPRRIGKPGSSPLNPSGQHTTVDKYRCHKCGGRSIKTPTSPFLDASGTPTLPPPNISEGLTPTTRYLPVMSNLSIESPVRRRGHGPSNLSNIQVTSAMREDAMMYSPLTPNKKRRFEYAPPPTSNGRRPDGPYYPQTQFARRESLPPIQMRVSPPNSATMPPPRTPRDGRRGSLVELGPPPHDSSPRSVEEVLSAFPYPNKIKLLGRITPPYKETGTASPAYKESRGAIVAIEGDDLASVKELSEWLNEYLIKQKEFKPYIAEAPQVPSDDKEVTFEDYLDLIKEWHGKSKEMIKYITTPTSSPSSPPDTTMSDKDSDKDVSDRIDSATPPDSPVLAAATTTKPVIILPTFQLQASVAYASRIPIQDAYSATDHWQWMATLWRGTVGPDLTLYVKTYDAKEGHTGAKPDLDDPVRCLTVFKERAGKFTEADLRRVGFEVNEWIKGMGSGR
ncbi:hypothetical protein BDW02DRAFT_578284 [Decorospora gaudefroyi]|uniref:HMG box domain-containing protein n=1 Tax=Decorospora gaudefroyi TaxID=184978 RepID=A0A6A5KJX7_9PLEO|nr:hypothetical protein BDW02DRAFT_578284 [Decorospora gaudefroyi]